MIAICEDGFAFVFAYLITLYVSVFTHQSSNFYTRISALVLTSGLILRIVLLLVDSVCRYLGTNITQA